MAPCPKRKQSRKRTKRREKSYNLPFPQLVVDSKTGRMRLPHRPEKDRI